MKIHETLQTVYGDDAPRYPTVCKWAARFRVGRDSIDDDVRLGRPVTTCSPRNIARVKELVEEDARKTVKDVAALTGISHGSSHEILRRHLDMKKICARWVPHILTDEQKQKRVDAARILLDRYGHGNQQLLNNIVTGDETWIYYYEPPSREMNKVWLQKGGKKPTVAKRSRSVKKVLYTIFFDTSGIVLQTPTPQGTSVTGKYYSTQILPKVKKHYEQKYPESGMQTISLHHDNAPAHSSNVVREFLTANNIDVLSHPPYSPDLAPCDFWLFSKLKKMLVGQKYESRSAVGSGVHQYLRGIPKEDFAWAFREWLRRLQRCIDVDGEYFEKL